MASHHNAPKNQWRELSRRESGLYIHDAHGQSGSYSYANLVYVVVEGNKTTQEVRERVEQGEPLYLHERGDLSELFHIGAIATARLQGECRSLDRKVTRKSA